MITMPQFSASCLCKQYLTEISFKLDVFIAMEKCINELSYSESYINFFFYNNANNVNSNIYPIIKNIFFNDRI